MENLIKKQEKEFDKMGVRSGLYDACVDVEQIKKFIFEVRKETIKFEKERIIDWAEELIKEETKLYGTDKHGISLKQIKLFLK